MSQKVLNKRSSALVEGEAKLPTASQIEYGEIAVNFADGHETLSIKNNNNEIATFSSDEIVHSYVNNQVNTASGNIKTYVDNKISSIYKYKGSVTNYSNLPSSNLTVGDVYNVVNANGTYPAGTNYAWTGTEWDALGGTIDLSNYVENSSFTAHTGNSGIHLTTGAVETQIENKLANYLPLSGGTMAGNSKIIIPTDTGTQLCEISPTHVTVGTTFGEGASIGQNYVIVSENDGDEIAELRYNSLSFTNGNGMTTTATTYGINSISAKGKTLTFPSKTGTFALTSDIPSTASEIGALPTGTTLDNVSDGVTRKLSNYATQANFTAHTASTTVHVNSTEKSTWNGKQDSISDLSTIRNNASSGATAYSTVTAHTGNTTIHLPSVSSSDNGKILQVVNGQWALVTPVSIYSGNTAPSNVLGSDGDIYLQI